MEKEESDQSGKHNVVPDPNQKSEDVVDGDEGHRIPENVFPFFLVLIWTKDADANSTIQEVVRVFETKDQQLFQISQQIREKVIHREDVISDLKDLKSKYLNRLNQSADDKRDLLNDLYMALENSSLPKASSNNREKLQNHKLNSRMLHKTKNLAQERQLLREMNVSQQRRDNASTSPLKQTSDILSRIQQRHKHWYPYRDNLKICEILFEEIKKFEVTRKITKGLKQAIRNQVKIACNEVMELMKKKRPLEIKRKQLEEEIEATNEEIWSFQKHLKEKHHRNEASLFVLRGSDSISDDFWFLRHCNMEYDSLFCSGILRKKSFLKKLLK